jgi:hypothetical protein
MGDLFRCIARLEVSLLHPTCTACVGGSEGHYFLLFLQEYNLRVAWWMSMPLRFDFIMIDYQLFLVAWDWVSVSDARLAAVKIH